MKKHTPQQHQLPQVVGPSSVQAQIELETPPYRDSFTDCLLKGTQFFQTPLTGTIATVTSIKNWSSVLCDNLSASLSGPPRNMYGYGLSMCIMRQFLETSHTATHASLMDFRPVSRIAPAIPKMHQTIIQHFGDFTTQNGNVKVFRPYHSDLVATTALKKLFRAVGLLEVQSYMKTAQCTEAESASVQQFCNSANEIAFLTDPLGHAHLCDSIDELILMPYAKNNGSIFVPTASTLKHMFNTKRQAAADDASAARDVIADNFQQQFVHNGAIIAQHQGSVDLLTDVMLSQANIAANNEAIANRMGISLLNIDRRRLIKVLCLAFSLNADSIVNIATGHFTDVQDFKPSRHGSAMQLVCQYGNESFHRHILAPSDIQIGYALSTSTFVKRHGFKITSKTSTATLKTKFLQFAAKA